MIKKLTMLAIITFIIATLLGNIAPTFTIEDIHGNELRSTVLLERGPIFLDFWHVGCRPCLAFLPHFSRFAEEFPKMTFIAVSTDPPRTRERALSHVRSNRFKFITAFDSNRELTRLFNVTSVPHKVIINQDGTIAYLSTGFSAGDEEKIRSMILDLRLPIED